MFVCMHVCILCYPPKCYAFRATNVQAFIDERMFGSSQIIYVEFHSAIIHLRTVELPFIVVANTNPQRYVNNYVQLLTAACVLSSIVRIYVTQGLNAPIKVSITSQLHDAIDILTGSTTFQGIDGYFCDNDNEYPDIW